MAKDEKKETTSPPLQAEEGKGLLLSVNRIREARNRDAARSDGGTSGKSDTNDSAF